jgi:2-iminobutanoate/2-iminopropanoate deaminase
MAATKQVLTPAHTPKALGPYSVAVLAGDFLFASGQLGIDPESSKLVSGGIEAETRQVLTNVKNTLAGAGLDLSNVVKTTVFLRDMADFAQMNGIYAEFFTSEFPARSTVQVAALPLGAALEIEVIALVNQA